MSKKKEKSRVKDMKELKDALTSAKEAKQSAINSEADPKQKKKLQKELLELEKQDSWTVAKLRLLQRYGV